MKNLIIIILLVIVCIMGLFLFMQSKDKQEDLYIKILTYGKENIGKPIKYSQIQQYLDNEGYEYDEFALRQFFTKVFIDKHSPSGNNPGIKPSERGNFYLESHGYFNLLDYTKLVEARQSSKTAVNLATAALVVSIITLVTSICLSIKQINRLDKDT